MADAPPPRAFVSYSWSSDDHTAWVLALAERLRSDGVDVVIDRWYLKPGHDQFKFMEQMVTDPQVRRVLMVCDKKYASKADARSGGVGTEAQIISAEVYTKVTQEKFIPLLRERDETNSPYLPAYLKSRIYIDFSNDDAFAEAYESLLRTLHEAPEFAPPPIGKPPAHLLAKDAPVVSTAGKYFRLKESVEKGKPNTAVAVRDYLENLSDALEGFRVTSATEQKVERDEVVLDHITRMRPYRDEFIDFCALYASQLDTEEGYVAVHDFLERFLTLYHPSASMQSYSEWYFEPHYFVGYEWVLYLVGTLIHYRRFTTVSRFMDDTYQYRPGNRTEYWSSRISEFNHHVASLDEYRNRRLNLRRGSVVADVIRDSASCPRIPFSTLFQADVVLFIRPYILNPNAGDCWYPRLLGFARAQGTLDLFARATTAKGAAAVRDLFGSKDVVEFARRLGTALSSRSVQALLRDRQFWFGADMTGLFNWTEIQRASGS